MENAVYRDYYKLSGTDFPITNILGLSDPGSFECSMNHFQRTHATLTITAFSHNSGSIIPGYVLNFVMVSFIDIFPWWMGLDVSIASPDQCVEIIEQLHHTTFPVPKELVEGFNLFVIKSEKRQLRILASKLEVHPIKSKEQYKILTK
mgnify:CR=1 FL=1